MMAKPPNKEERAKCWEARDSLWKCLDDNDNDKSKCVTSRKAFEENCTKTWVKYFERRREYLKFKDKMEKEGYEPLESKDKSNSQNS